MAVANQAAACKHGAQQDPLLRFSSLSILPHAATAAAPSSQGAAPAASSGPAYQVVDRSDRSEKEVETLTERMTSAPARTRLGSATNRLAPLSSFDGMQHAAAPQSSFPVDAGLSAELKKAQQGGESLTEDVKDSFAPPLGHSLQNIRVHKDATAHRLSLGLSARAFRQGSHLFFRQGEFAPKTQQGEKLLAHELIHATQGPKTAQFIYRKEVDALEFANQLAGQTPAKAGPESKSANQPAARYSNIKQVFADWFTFTPPQREGIKQAYLSGQVNSKSQERALAARIMVQLVGKTLGRTLTRRAIKLLQDPSKLQQGRFAICGPIVLLYDIIANRPFLFIDLIYKMNQDRTFIEERTKMYRDNPSQELANQRYAIGVRQSEGSNSNPYKRQLIMMEAKERIVQLDFMMAHFIMKLGQRSAPKEHSDFPRDKGHHLLGDDELLGVAASYADPSLESSRWKNDFREWRYGVFEHILEASKETNTSVIASLNKYGVEALNKSDLETKTTPDGGHYCILKSIKPLSEDKLSDAEKSEVDGDGDIQGYYEVILWSWGREISVKWTNTQLSCYFESLNVVPLRQS